MIQHLLAVLSGGTVRVFATFTTFLQRYDATTMTGCTIGIRNTRHSICSRGNTFSVPNENEEFLSNHEMFGYRNRCLLISISKRETKRTCNLSQKDSPNLCNILDIFWKAKLRNNSLSHIDYPFCTCLHLKRDNPTHRAKCI